MFERFRGSRRTEAGASSVSVREREAARSDARREEDPGARAREMDERPAAGDRPLARESATGATAPDRTAIDNRRFARDTPPDGDRVRDQDRDPVRDDRGDRDVMLERERDDDRATHRRAPVMGTDAMDTMRSRQRERFGGIKWGSAFFGWLSAIGLAALLSGILVGAGVALGLSTSDAQSAGSAETIGLGGGIALLAVLAVAWFCGGYVAGRMARFDGARQGIGVWAWTIIAALIVAGLAAIGGSEYDVFERLNLPRIAIGDSTLTSGGAITGLAAIVVTLLAAIVGGKVGERFHKRVDRVATSEYVAP
jgi:hypothetical protein